jgi:hypothetical protein
MQLTLDLPSRIDTAPAEVQAELLRLQTLSVDELRQVAQGQIPEA